MRNLPNEITYEYNNMLVVNYFSHFDTPLVRCLTPFP